MAPGHFIPRSLIDEQTTRWGVRRLLTEARVLSTLLRCGADNPGIAALDAALLLQGVTILNSTPDIHYWREGATVTTHPSVFRSVTVSPHVVVAAEARELRGKPSAPLSPCKTSEPRLTGLAETILDMARFSHPLLAFVNGSLALRELAQYDKFTLAASQKRTKQAVAQMLGMADALPLRKNLARARHLISCLDPAIESPAEAIVLWAVEILTRGSDSAGPDFRPDFKSQYEVVSQGNRYFLDVAFPEAQIAIEFHGTAKMEEGGSAQRRFLRRQADLTRDGWHVRRLTTSDYLDLPTLFRILSQDLESRGVRVSAPGGPLWRAVPQSMLDPDRLF